MVRQAGFPAERVDHYNPAIGGSLAPAIDKNIATALDGSAGRRQRSGREEKLTSKVEALEARLAKKDNVIAEISEEFVRLKKEIGEP